MVVVYKVDRLTRSLADFAKLKALLRKAAERTVEGLWAKIAELLPAFSPSECANYFAAAGYDPT